MPPCPIINRDRGHVLTGRVRYRMGIERLGLFRRRTVLVLMVEEEFLRVTISVPIPPPDLSSGGRRLARWRDARVEDFPLPTPSKSAPAAPEDP